MTSQEPQQEKLENSNWVDRTNDFVLDNVTKAVVYFDPITNKSVLLFGSVDMKITMEEYAKLRVPADIRYNIIDVKSTPNEALPDFDIESSVKSEPLNMFYRYLNAL